MVRRLQSVWSLRRTYPAPIPVHADEVSRLEHLIEASRLPTQMPAGWRDAEFMRALKLDKKRAGDQVEFVLLDRLGHALTRKLSFDEIVAKLA